jgi:hypothetical protein
VTDDLASGELEGHLDDVLHDRILGWARDKASPERPVLLEIVDNGVVIGEIAADLLREGLAEAGIGTGRYAFEALIPGGLSRHEDHVVHVRRASDGQDLPNSPWELKKTSEARFNGCLDQATRMRLSGWAQDGEVPRGRAVLRVLDNGVPVIRVVANLYRPDLEESGIGDGRYGFDIYIPDHIAGGLSPLTRHAIEITNERTGATLTADPIVIEPAGSFTPELEQSVANAIAAVADAAEQDRVMTFLMTQVDRLRQSRAETEGQHAERLAYKQSRRRLGPDADDAGLIDPGPRALVIDARGSPSVLSHMQALRRLGYGVSFAAADDMIRPALAEEGITRYGAPFEASVEEVLRRHAGQFDVIWLHGADIASRYLALAHAHYPRARILYALDHLHHVRLERQAAIEERPELLAASHRMRLTECTAAWSAHAVIAHTAIEAEQLRRLVPEAHVHVVPWIVPLATAHSFASRRGVAFIAGRAGDADQDAARFLVETVMPLVWQTDPTVECVIPASIRRLARPGLVTIEDDVKSALARVRVTAAPSRFGAGVNGAVVDSLAAGVPCVMSEIAAEGLALSAPLRRLVCQDAAAMAASILRLHTDEASHREAAAAGVSLIRQTFGADKVTDALRSAIEGRREAIPRGARG